MINARLSFHKYSKVMVQSICLFVCSKNDSVIGVCRFKGQGQCHCKEKERLLEFCHLVPGL